MMRGPVIGAMLWLAGATLTGVALAANASLEKPLPEKGTPRPAVIVNGEPVSLATLQLLHGVIAQREPEKSLANVLREVVQNHVLSDYAEHQYGDAALFDGARVGIAPTVAAEDGMIATLRMAFRGRIEHALADANGGARWVEQTHPLDRDRLAALLGVQRGGPMRLDDRITPERESHLRDISLLEYRFPNSMRHTVTLYDVWRRQNTQGRNALLALDTALAQSQALQIVANRYIVDWAIREGGIAPSVPDELTHLVAERDRREALSRYMGAQMLLHFDSPYLKKLQDSVAPADIARYYADNPGEFKRIERVEVRQMRFADEVTANAASARLNHGEDFEQVARETSIAPSAKQGGYLGWIEAGRAETDWLAQLAMATRPGIPTRPVREPEDAKGNAGWEIIQVLKRVEGRYPLDSETVRYTARQAIASKWAVRDFVALRTRLSQSATLDLDRHALGFDRKALKLEEAS
ncbi:MAG: peptidylprolyl isomerase [Burkholderiales bacterium]|nr:peptidylprolyl isomerase [Burkholderiales bacterium]